MMATEKEEKLKMKEDGNKREPNIKNQQSLHLYLSLNQCYYLEVVFLLLTHLE